MNWAAAVLTVFLWVIGAAFAASFLLFLIASICHIKRDPEQMVVYFFVCLVFAFVSAGAIYVATLVGRNVGW